MTREHAIAEREALRWVKGWENLYAVSASGFVWTARYSHSKHLNWRKLNSSLSDGYFIVTLARDGKRETRKVHRMVAEAFIDNVDVKPCINHINANRQDNRACNLEWVTPKENHRHAMRLKRNSRGENHGMHKLLESDVVKIRDMHSLGFGYHRISHVVPITKSQIARICTGKNWKELNRDNGRTWARAEKEERV